MKKLFFIGLLLSSLQVLAADPKPYKIVVFTDETANTKAEQFKTYLQAKPPFSKMGEKLEIQLVKLTKEEMDCKNSNPDAPRIISCNNNLLRRKQREADANISLAFTSNGSGGAGGNIPVASMDYPIQTMFHEMLHTYGLSDEYDYSESERGVYCRNPRSSANVVYFKDTPPYSDDPGARSTHGRDVPWMGGIPRVHLITSGTALGSTDSTNPTPGTQLLGLYRGGSCDSAATPGWRPYKNSIMKGYEDDTIYPLYEEVIVKNMESSLGRTLDLPPPPEKCLDQNFDLKKIEHLHHDVEEAVGHVH